MNLFPSLQQILLVVNDNFFCPSHYLLLHIPHLPDFNWIKIDLRFTVSLKDMDMSRLVIV